MDRHTSLRLLLLLPLLALLSCQSAQLNQPADAVDNIILNSYTTLKVGDNTLILSDYIIDPSQIDSVSTSSHHLLCTLSDDKTTLKVTTNSEMEPLSNIKIWQQGVAYTVPCKRSTQVNYLFSYDSQGKKHKSVQVFGQMNNWNINADNASLTLTKEGKYEGYFELSPGNYQYQLCIDGKCGYDANQPNRVDNNSVLVIADNSADRPTLYTQSFDQHSITIESDKPFNQIMVYWQNYHLPSELVLINGTHVVIRLPKECEQIERSYVRVIAASSSISNDLLIPLEKGRVMSDMRESRREDHHAQIIYSLMIDRFKNGTTDNDHPLNRPDVNPKVDYWGGDIVGIQQVIESKYFDSLGVNTLWISPINQNPLTPYGYYKNSKIETKFSGYHGYWPISSSKIDYRFGTNEQMKTMVETAHQNNINILLDYVANHVHEQHPLYKQHPEYATALYLPDGTLNVEKWDEQRLTTWFDTFMPSLDYANPKLSDMMADSAVYWIKEFNLDGFRHDACKHIPESFWRTLTSKLKKQTIANRQKPIYQIGETYGSAELIGSYINTGMLDAQFDFNIFDAAGPTIAKSGVPLTHLQSVLHKSLSSYGYHHLMGNISGNHDRARFISLASGEVSYNEDAKAAGWQREIAAPQPAGYQKMLLLNILNMTIPGVPVIYYGDEFGMYGANDPDCRKMMIFNHLQPQESKLLADMKKITHLRRANIALNYGDFRDIACQGNYWVYGRQYFNHIALVILNNDTKECVIEFTIPEYYDISSLKSCFQHPWSINKDKISITLPPLSGEVIYN